MTSNPNQQASSLGQYDLVLVDQSKDAEFAAQAEANARLTEELNEGGRFKRFVKSIWKGNIAKDYYRHKYKKEAERRIVETQDVLIHESTSEEHRDNAMLATIERFQSEYDEMVHTQAGESRHEVESSSEIASSLKGIIREFAEGRLDEANLFEERARIFQAYREENGQDLAGAGKVQIDNLLDVARAVRGAVEHGESLDAIIDGMKVISGESRSGVRTEVNASRTDRIFEKLGKSRIGTLIGSEATIAAATIAMSVLRLGSKRVVGAAALTVAPGIGAGLLAGLREKKRVKEDWAQHSREMAQGKVYDEVTANRRREMEETRYETVSADELIAELEAYFEDDALHTDDAIRTALEQLSAITARENYSDINKVDLISYSAATEVERERFQLALSRAQLKVLLRDRLSDDDTALRLGLTPGMDIDGLIQAGADNFTGAVIEGDVATKDAAFKKLRNRRVAKAAAAGVAVGLTFGIAGQELGASLSSSREGLVEQLWNADNQPVDGEVHQTIAASFAQDMHHNIVDSITHHIPGGSYDSYGFGAHGNMSLSDDMSMEKSADGTMTIKGNNGNILADNLVTDSKGNLTPESLSKLHDADITVEDTSHTVSLPPTTETKTVGLDEYLVQHNSDTTHVTRDFWYNNDTPKFDQNELRLQWGNHGDGIARDGSFQFNIANMQPDGSHNDDHSLAWQEAARDGNLKMAISASAGSQTEVFMVNINPDGSINIPEGSPAAQFFTEQNGHAVFNGKYAEVVEVAGKDDGGVTHIRPLATVVGSDEAQTGNYTIEHQVKHTEYRPNYKLTSNGYNTVERVEQSTFTEVAPVIPLVSRRSLEALKSRAEILGVSSYYNRYGEHIDGGETVPRSEMSPRLWKNPDAELNPYEELKWYKETVRKKRGDEYVRDIEQLIDSSPELKNVPAGLKNIVKIPVNAAGDAESRDIYNVLTKAYGGQDKDTLAESIILLHVNWFDDAVNDPEKREVIEKTRAEIARAKADNPHMHIAVVETEWKRAEIKGGVIGHVSRRLNDAALFAVENAMSNGQVDPSQDVLLIRNDADPKGISKNYLKRYSQSAFKNKEVDVFTGTTTFDNTKASTLPGFVFAANFMQSLDLLASTREGHVHTGGANFGVRASTFAAVGCNGFDETNTGAGSDDVSIGRRIQFARTRQTATNYATGGVAGYFRAFRERKTRGSSYYQASSVASPAHSSAKRRVALRVTGARIDTDSDREEVLYQNGRPIIHTWDDGAFDVGGYANRNNGLNGDFEKEQALKDPDVIIERIRNDMEGSINIHQSEARIRSALAFVFSGMSDRPSTDGYRLVRQGNRYHFEFTEAGKAEVSRRLTRDSKGRFDAYGSKKLRQMYGEARSTAKRQPTHRSMIRV